MSATTSSDQYKSVTSKNRIFIGTDGEGFNHHFIKSESTIIVIDSNGHRVDQVEQVSANS